MRWMGDNCHNLVTFPSKQHGLLQPSSRVSAALHKRGGLSHCAMAIDWSSMTATDAAPDFSNSTPSGVCFSPLGEPFWASRVVESPKEAIVEAMDN